MIISRSIDLEIITGISDFDSIRFHTSLNSVLRIVRVTPELVYRMTHMQNNMLQLFFTENGIATEGVSDIHV